MFSCPIQSRCRSSVRVCRFDPIAPSRTTTRSDTNSRNGLRSATGRSFLRPARGTAIHPFIRMDCCTPAGRRQRPQVAGPALARYFGAMPSCPESVLKLIERFDQQADQVRSADYNETQVRVDFVNPLFAALGWDVPNEQGYAEQYRDVVHEDKVKVGGATKAPDYSFRIGGTRKFFLEAKKPFVNLKSAWEPAYQLRRYGWSAKLAVSLLTDFEEFAVYDCRVAPKQFDKPAVARREYIGYHDYPARWDFIEGTLSKRAVPPGRVRPLLPDDPRPRPAGVRRHLSRGDRGVAGQAGRQPGPAERGVGRAGPELRRPADLSTGSSSFASPRTAGPKRSASFKPC